MKKKYLKLIIILVVILLVGSIYLFFKNASVKIIINNEEFILDKESKVIDLNTLNSDFATFIEIIPKNYKVKINNKIISKPQKVSLGILKLNSENKIKIEIKKYGTNKWKSFIINTLPSKFLEYDFFGEGGDDLEYYLTTYKLDVYKNQHYIYKLDKKGNVTFYRSVDDISYNFKKNKIGNKVRYTYLERVNKNNVGTNVFFPTKLVVLNEKYEKLEEIFFKDSNKYLNLDNHDYIYLGDNHYILATFEEKVESEFPNLKEKEVSVWNSRIQEVKDNKILWEFQSVNNKNLYDYVNLDYEEFDNWTDRDFRVSSIDYMHFNSMVIDPKDGNLVCSFRNIDAIIKIDRKTGKIIWILGGIGDEFGLSDSEKFSSQHSISYLKDHSLLVYDNGLSNNKTRILKIKLDEAKKEIENYESYDLNYFCPYMGSVKVLDEEKDRYLIAYGSGNNTFAFEELNLKTMHSFSKLKLKIDSTLYNVNKY